MSRKRRSRETRSLPKETPEKTGSPGQHPGAGKSRNLRDQPRVPVRELPADHPDTRHPHPHNHPGDQGRRTRTSELLPQLRPGKPGDGHPAQEPGERRQEESGIMRLERYPCRDAARLSLRGGKLHRTVTVDDRTHVGLDPDGRALWVSLLSVSQGANLDLLTQEERHQARRLLGETREDNAPAGRKCTGLNRTARKGSNRCTRDVTRTLRDSPPAPGTTTYRFATSGSGSGRRRTGSPAPSTRTTSSGSTPGTGPWNAPARPPSGAAGCRKYRNGLAGRPGMGGKTPAPPAGMTLDRQPRENHWSRHETRASA